MILKEIRGRGKSEREKVKLIRDRSERIRTYNFPKEELQTTELI